MASIHTSEGGYVLGHSDFELKRLTTQARVIDPMTRRFFQSAGISSGMRVLDVGSGAGDVAFLLAELVGPEGEVIGIDRSASALSVARSRASERGFSQVTFVEGEPGTHKFESTFDAAAGRYVLMFQSDPVALLQSVVQHVAPGGIVAFHEPDWRGVQSHPAAPTYDRCCQWIIQTARRSGSDDQMGFRLHATFLRAGLSSPQMAVEAQIGGGESALETWELIADLTVSIAETIASLGIATAEEIGVETLHDRIRAEVQATNSVLMGRYEIGAWAKKPS